ncbi:MAG TPA: hypothetical protein VGF59_30020 [Bryobacteraceae bacterium]|jgi:hypothetical protein
MPFTTIEALCTKYESFRFSYKPGELDEIKDEEERWTEIARRNRAAADHATDFEPPLYNVWPGFDFVGNFR